MCWNLKHKLLSSACSCLLFWKGFYILQLFPSACIEKTSPFRNLTASVCWKTSQTCLPALQMYTHACRHAHTSLCMSARPSAPIVVSLCIKPQPQWPSKAERLRDTIDSNPSFFSLFICFLFLPSHCASLSLKPVALFPFCHNPKTTRKPWLSISTLQPASTRTSGSASCPWEPQLQTEQCQHLKACKTNRWHLERKGPTFLNI